MHDTDDLSDTLKSFWFFMLIFFGILAALVGYVNLLGALEKLDLRKELVIVKETIVAPESRVLGISADIDGNGMMVLQQNVEVKSSSGMPYFEIDGDGIIEVAYSNDSHGFFYAPKGFRLLTRDLGDSYLLSKTTVSRSAMMHGENYDRLRDSYCVMLFSDIINILGAGGKDAKYFKNVSSDMREYCTITNQVVGEAYAKELPQYNPNEYMGPPDYTLEFSRHVYISHMFITMYDDTYKTKATATIRIKSRGNWVYGSRTLNPAVLVGCNATSEEDAYPGTTLELISYWQAE